MGHIFVGVEVAGSKTHHGVSFEGSLAGARSAQRFSSGAREHFTASRAECTLGASAPLHGRSRHLRSRGRSPHSGGGRENSGGPRGTARVASAGPFVLPLARGEADVGQRLAVLEGQILDQRGVRRTSSGEKGLTLPAVPTPPLPEPGEEVVQQSREAVTRTPEDRKSLLRVRLEGVRAAFNATKPRRLHHGGRKDVLRTMATRAMIFVAEGEERERKLTRKEVHTRRQQERKRKKLSSGSSAGTSESDTSNSETAMGRGSRSKIMRAVEDRPGELILQYVTDETKLRAPLEERGRMIDVANLASKYHATLRAEAKRKDQPWTARGAANARGGARRSMGRAVGSRGRHTSPAVSSCRSQLRGADRMAPGSLHRSAPFPRRSRRCPWRCAPRSTSKHGASSS